MITRNEVPISRGSGTTTESTEIVSDNGRSKAQL